MKILPTILRTTIAAAAAFFLILFIFPMLLRIINIGNLAGVLLCLCIIAMCIPPVAGAISSFFYRNTATKIAFRTLSILGTVFLSYGIIVTAGMMISSCSHPTDNATVVVLGAQVRPTGEPSEILKKRIEAAETFLNAHPDSVAVLSGGQGDDEVKSEAQCMYEIMTADGIAPDRLYLEDKSKNTRENFLFSQQVIEENGLNPDIAIVTDGFHQLRAHIIARKQGMNSNIGSVSANTNFLYVPTYTLREWFALPTAFIR